MNIENSRLLLILYTSMSYMKFYNVIVIITSAQSFRFISLPLFKVPESNGVIIRD